MNLKNINISSFVERFLCVRLLTILILAVTLGGSFFITILQMKKLSSQAGCRFAGISQIKKSGESTIIWTTLPDSKSCDLTILLTFLIEFCFAFSNNKTQDGSP